MIEKAADRAGGIPRFSFADDAPGPQGAVAQWLETVHLLFDAEPLRPPGEGFAATLRAFKLGPMLIGRARAQAQRFIRDNPVLARGGCDWLLIQFYVTGGYRGTTSHGPIDVRAGDISMLDLACTLSTEADDFDNINIIIPRALLASRMPVGANLHGLVLRRELGFTKVLQRHMLAIDEFVDELDALQSEALVDGTLALLSAAFAQAIPGPAGSTGSTDAIAMAIRRHIDTNLANPKLGVAGIAAHFGVSRATLYRLVTPLGGISDYIRRARLQRAYADLWQTDGQSGRVSVVARRWGFGSEATFARLFKATYGVCPSKARKSERHFEPSREIANPVVHWMRSNWQA